MFDDIIGKKEPTPSPVVHDTLPNDTSSSGTNVITEINVADLEGYGEGVLDV